MSREYTVEEMREKFLSELRTIAWYWSDQEVSKREMCDGVVFSILNVLDGMSGGSPAYDLIPHPHEDDKEFLISEGEDYYPEGVVINDCYLHEMYYQHE